MKHLFLVLCTAVFLLFVACSDSDNATSGPQTASNADMEVQTYSELPFCAKKQDGKIAYVADQEQSYICSNSRWVEDNNGSTNSSVKSSSSSVAISASSFDVVSGLTGNLLTDARDGQSYKTVVVGSQTWMAQNLNYETANSYCYNDSTKYCEKYGRLYTWAAAMDSMGMWSTNGKGCGYDATCSPTYPVRGVCPSGWHLPSGDEFEALFTAVGGWYEAGIKLKSTSGWSSWEYYGVKSGNGLDNYSFSALPAGYKYNEDDYGYEGKGAKFWCSTKVTSYSAHYMYLNNAGDNSGLGNDDKYSGFSIRCVKDNSVEKSSSSEKVKSSSSTKVSSSSKKVESSSGVALSSSVVRSSSSWSGGKSGTIEYITDSRDGQTYKTVVIGTQTWMAQNLNYETANSYCNNDSTKYCEKYGRLYTWAAAMDSAGTWSTNGKGCGYGSTCLPTGTVQGVCPVGWHLPSRDEFEALFTAVGGQSAAGKVLKSTSGWSDLGNGSSGNGTDAYSFSVLPAGNRNDRGEYYFSEGYNARFWNSTEFDSNNAYGVHLYYGNDNVFLDYVSKYLGYSVRCVKDD